jgi:coenzyme F420 biosynthesis associated uncharacterized protein
MIDWPLAQRLAALVAGQSDARPPRVDLRALAQESERHVVAYTGLAPRTPVPEAEGVGRAEWIGANVAAMRTLLDPPLAKLEAKTGKSPAKPALRLAAGVVLTAEVGVVLGFLAQRVLGQYDLVLLDSTPDERPPRLLFVMPNLGGAVRAFGADEREFMLWVALHEVTHAVQFAGVPWLQGHLAGLVQELLASAEVRIDAKRALRLPSTDDLKRLVDAVRTGDIVSFVASERERATLERMQATMAVLEGYAEHVMDAVGAPLLPSLDRLRAALDRRRRSQSAPARVFQRLLGLELKLRQYETGKRFCDAVVQAGGIAALNRVWDAPESLPTLAELDDPQAWLRRTHVPPALTA